MDIKDMGLTALRRAIKTTSSGSGKRRRFPDTLKREVAQWAKSSGGTREQQAKQLGIGLTTLSRWCRETQSTEKPPVQRGKLRRVAVVSQVAETAAAPAGLTLRLQGGASVSGLTVSELAELLRRVGT